MMWNLSRLSDEALEKDAFLEASMGLVYGLHIYTTFVWPVHPEVWKAHWHRLQSDASAMDLDWQFDEAAVLRQIKSLFKLETPVIRLAVIADISQYKDFWVEPNQALPSHLWLSMRANAPIQSAITLQTALYTRPMPLVKSAAMAESVLLKRRSIATGADDVLFIGKQINSEPHQHNLAAEQNLPPSLDDYFLRECGTANIFILEEITQENKSHFQLRTPNPYRDECLPGITRQQVLMAAEKIGLSIFDDNEPILLSALANCQGAFMGNAALGLIAVNAIQHASNLNLPKWDIQWTASAQDCFKLLQEHLKAILSV